jgi:hypothetical protein
VGSRVVPDRFSKSGMWNMEYIFKIWNMESGIWNGSKTRNIPEYGIRNAELKKMFINNKNDN